mmetsp:Transcript_56158/g.149888  ORF Transcript_56158/g.149888 Transcript_56158/m.149888 type:complete len:200 (+) Transcript_56158:560-1159(+)
MLTKTFCAARSTPSWTISGEVSGFFSRSSLVVSSSGVNCAPTLQHCLKNEIHKARSAAPAVAGGSRSRKSSRTVAEDLSMSGICFADNITASNEFRCPLKVECAKTSKTTRNMSQTVKRTTCDKTQSSRFCQSVGWMNSTISWNSASVKSVRAAKSKVFRSCSWAINIAMMYRGTVLGGVHATKRRKYRCSLCKGFPCR